MSLLSLPNYWLLLILLIAVALLMVFARKRSRKKPKADPTMVEFEPYAQIHPKDPGESKTSQEGFKGPTRPAK